MPKPKKSAKPSTPARKKRASAVSPSKKNREAAKAAATRAVREIRGRGEKPQPPPIVTPADAIRTLVRDVEEEPNGQRVIPGAGPAQRASEERPGDNNPYVLTLRIRRGEARQMRVIAAHNGHNFPAQWLLHVMRSAMTAELARIEGRKP